MVQLNFDASQVQPSVGFEAIPAGWYNAKIVGDELKPTKSGEGQYLEQKFVILDGQYQGRNLFTRLNLRNPSADAERIGRGQLSAIAHAVGILQVGDSQALFGHPMKIRVKYRPANENYEASNDIVDWKNINDNSVQVGSSGPAAPNLSGAGFGAPASAVPATPAGFANQAPQNFAGAGQPAPNFSAAPRPPAPPAPPAPPQVQRPADPSHIHAPGTPGEMWWINGAWQPATQAPAAPAAPPAPPAPVAPAPAFAAPTGAQPWETQGAAQAPAYDPNAQQNFAPQAPQQQAIQAAQGEVPPWER